MALIEIHIYPFDKSKVPLVPLIKMYRTVTGEGLAEAKYHLDQVAFDTRNPVNVFYSKRATKTDILFWKSNDVKAALELNEQLKLLGCRTELLYNGNMKTLDLLYGKT